MESEKESVKELIVDVSEEEVRLALLDNHRLIELNKESSNGHSFTVGDVFLGKVKKVMPALNAAFVDIGDEKEAFIHYLDLGLYFNAFDEFVRKTNTNTNANDLFTGRTWSDPRKGGADRESSKTGTDGDRPDRKGADFDKGFATHS